MRLIGVGVEQPGWWWGPSATTSDRLAAGQCDDGGWAFPRLASSPVAAAECRGSVTVDALVTLRENGRMLINR